MPSLRSSKTVDSNLEVDIVALNLLSNGTGPKLIDVPFSPHESTMKEASFIGSSPDGEMTGKVLYIRSRISKATTAGFDLLSRRTRVPLGHVFFLYTGILRQISETEARVKAQDLHVFWFHVLGDQLDEKSAGALGQGIVRKVARKPGIVGSVA